MSKEFAKEWLEINKAHLSQEEIVAAIKIIKERGQAEIAEAIEAEIAGVEVPQAEEEEEEKPKKIKK